jgi:hypothetical protein
MASTDRGSPKRTLSNTDVVLSRVTPARQVQQQAQLREAALERAAAAQRERDLLSAQLQSKESLATLMAQLGAAR